MKTEPIPIGSRRHLFIDESLIDKSDAVRLVVNRPVKTCEKLVTADRPWESTMIGPYCTVMDDDGRCRMWYESYAKTTEQKLMGLLCYAESVDGVSWEKQVVGKIEFDGSKDNNIVFPLPGRLYHGGTVFKDPTAGSSERYKLVYAIKADGLFGAYSADGICWSVYEGHLLRHQCDTQNVCFWDERIGKYVCYVRHNVPIRSPNVLRTIGRSETEDFLHWPSVETVLSFDQRDPADMDLYNSAAVKYARTDDVYLIMTSGYHHNDDVLIPQLAVSRDGLNWSRPDRKPFLELGGDTAFDRGMIHTCVGQIIRDKEIWIYYRGIEKKHNQPFAQTVYGGTISRAILRLDGFVSLDAGSQGGAAVTRPLVFSGDRLELNYQTCGDGMLQIQIDPVQGTSPKSWVSEIFTGDHVCRQLSQPERMLRELSGVPVRITFKMKNVKLFSFRFGNQ